MLDNEVLGYENGTFHSYLCNSLEKDYKDHFGSTLKRKWLHFIPGKKSLASVIIVIVKK